MHFSHLGTSIEISDSYIYNHLQAAIPTILYRGTVASQVLLQQPKQVTCFMLILLHSATFCNKNKCFIIKRGLLNP